MNAGKIAEYAVGIFVPLGMFWAGERDWFRRTGVGESTPDSARGDCRNRKQRWGRCPRYAPPFWNLGHHASRRMSRILAMVLGKPEVRSAFEPLSKRFASLSVKFAEIGYGAWFT
ncbi:MAG: hypothetical protein ACYC9S_09740 [Leptospirales bacterium]